MTNLSPRIDEDTLEEAIVAASRGRMSLQQFLRTLLDSDIVVPSATAIQADGSGLTPLLFNKQGTEMMAIFTSLSRAEVCGAATPFALKINARMFLSRLSKEVGVVINPGCADGLDVTPGGITNILRDFGIPSPQVPAREEEPG